MAQVPYTPYPTARPSGQGIGAISVSAPAAAFGGASAQGGEMVGRALEGLGRGLERSGDELFRRAVAMKELQNETAAKEADAQYMMEVGKLHAEFNSLQGNAAVAAYPKYMTDMQALRKRFADDLPNDSARKMYDSASLSFMARNIFNGAGHAASQQKQAAIGASSARIDAMTDTILRDPSDDLTFRRLTKGIEGEVQSQGELRGWDRSQTDVETQKRVSSAWAHRITGLARTEPFAANEMLEANRDQLKAVDLERVENTVRQNMRLAGSRNISDKINEDLYTPDVTKPDRSLQQRINEGMDEAKRTAPNDPLLPDYVRERITADWTRHKAAVKDFEYTNRQTVEGALMGGPGGKMPTNIDELKADPKVEAAYSALPESVQRHYMGVLAKNAKGDFAWSPEGLKSYQEMKGKAYSDPLSFLDTDVTDLNIPMSARRELVNLQQRIKNKSEGDPRVTSALRTLNPIMIAAGIDRRKDESGYFQFIGGLQEALNEFQDQNKRQPKFEEVKEIGQRLLQEQFDPNKFSFWGMATRTTPLYQLTPPDKDIEAIKQAWKADKGTDPTDEQIRQIYVRKLYRDRFGGTSLKTTPAPQVPRSQ